MVLTCTGFRNGHLVRTVNNILSRGASGPGGGGEPASAFGMSASWASPSRCRYLSRLESEIKRSRAVGSGRLAKAPGTAKSEWLVPGARTRRPRCGEPRRAIFRLFQPAAEKLESSFCINQVRLPRRSGSLMCCPTVLRKSPIDSATRSDVRTRNIDSRDAFV